MALVEATRPKARREHRCTGCGDPIIHLPSQQIDLTTLRDPLPYERRGNWKFRCPACGVESQAFSGMVLRCRELAIQISGFRRVEGHDPTVIFCRKCCKLNGRRPLPRG